MAVGRRNKEQQTTDVAAPETQQIAHRDSDDVVAEVMATRSAFTEDELRGASWDELIALTEQRFGASDAADQVMGDGFTVLATEDKAMLCGMPLFLMEWNFNDGDMGRFVSVRCLAKLPGGVVGKYIINDGSTGVMEQLAKYTKKTQRMGGLLVRKGLRRSDYTYEDPATGESRPATTYYIDTSAE